MSCEKTFCCGGESGGSRSLQKNGQDEILNEVVANLFFSTNSNRLYFVSNKSLTSNKLFGRPKNVVDVNVNILKSSFGLAAVTAVAAGHSRTMKRMRFSMKSIKTCVSIFKSKVSTISGGSL